MKTRTLQNRTPRCFKNLFYWQHPYNYYLSPRLRVPLLNWVHPTIFLTSECGLLSQNRYYREKTNKLIFRIISCFSQKLNMKKQAFGWRQHPRKRYLGSTGFIFFAEKRILVTVWLLKTLTYHKAVLGLCASRCSVLDANYQLLKLRHAQKAKFLFSWLVFLLLLDIH